MSKGILRKISLMLTVIMLLSLGMVVEGKQVLNKQSIPRKEVRNGKNVLVFSESGTLYPVDSNSISSFIIEPDIDIVHINNGVELTGGFAIRDRKNTITIEGESSKDSIIHGFKRGEKGVPEIGASFQDRVKYCNISSLTDFANYKYGYAKYNVILKNFKSINPAYYHINFQEFQQVVADNLYITETEHNVQANRDGILGGNGSKIKNCTIDTTDDSIKCYYGDYTITNTTIIHNQNGAPIQFGWDDSSYDYGNITLDDVTIKSNSTRSYNQGVISWAAGTEIANRTIDLKGKGLKIINDNGSFKSHLIQFGSTDSYYGKKISNKTINFKGNIGLLNIDDIIYTRGEYDNNITQFIK